MYDYVIVGAGSAGCVLAGRLSEDEDARVLLLEAGGPDTNANLHIPAAFPSLYRSRWDWNFDTEPQKHVLDRRVYWPRGKVLGVSSSINAMIQIRGHRGDYDRWRDHWGCKGWGYDDVLPYFVRSEDNASKHDRFHGSGGPLHVSDQVRRTKIRTGEIVRVRLLIGGIGEQDEKSRVRGAPEPENRRLRIEDLEPGNRFVVVTLVA